MQAKAYTKQHKTLNIWRHKQNLMVFEGGSTFLIASVLHVAICQPHDVMTWTK